MSEKLWPEKLVYFLVGMPACGKSVIASNLFARLLREEPNIGLLEVSDLVKHWQEQLGKSDLLATELGSQELHRMLWDWIKSNYISVVSGAREPHLLHDASSKVRTITVFLDVPEDIRLQRFNQRQYNKVPFEAANARAIELGVGYMYAAADQVVDATQPIDVIVDAILMASSIVDIKGIEK